MDAVARTALQHDKNAPCVKQAEVTATMAVLMNRNSSTVLAVFSGKRERW